MRKSQELEEQIKNLQILADDMRTKKKQELRETLYRCMEEMKEYGITYKELFPHQKKSVLQKGE